MMTWRKAPVAIAGVGIALAILPFLKPPAFYESFLYLALFWIVLATSWNILSGYAGYFSFGHGAFFGAGVYTSATLAAKFNWPFLWTLPVAALVAAAIGVGVGAVAFRVKGVRGGQFQKITWKEPHRRGLFGKGAFLMVTSYANRTTPVLRGAYILEKLLASSSLEVRERYLAILFLSRIRERQKRLDDAAALLKEAAVHQTSLIAGAHNAQERGDAKAATTIVDRATRLGTDDPWWGYRFGQYWLVEGLFKELREEAVK